MNYSDPFGLCASDQTEKITFTKNEDGDWIVTKSCSHASGRWATEWTGILGRQTMMTALYGVAGRVAGLESALNAYGEVTGINGLGRAGDALLRGDVVGGGLQLAMSLPVVPGGSGARVLPAAARATMNHVHAFEWLGKYHGITWELASARLHAIRRALGRGGADNVLFDYTGGVWDPVTREWLGSLTEGGAKRFWR